MTQPYNVLFITADQFRGDCLSALKHPCVKTPHLDALAADGTLFTRHYAQAAPCSPARASLYTGLYLMNHRVCSNGTPHDARHSNIALEVRKANYDPLLFGYTDQAVDPRTTTADDPRMTTYESVLNGFSPHTHLTSDVPPKPWYEWLQQQGLELLADAKHIMLPKSQTSLLAGYGPTTEPPPISAEQTETAFISERFIDYMGAEHTAPWFAHVSFLRPHPPFIVPEPYNTMVDPADVPFPQRGDCDSLAQQRQQHPYLDFALSQIRQASFFPTGDGLVGDLSDDAVRILRATYFGMIAEVDAQIGRIISFLKKQGQYSNTLIIFTSDHGEMLGEHFMFGKLGYFDAAYHIPLIIRSPDKLRTRGQQVSRFTEAVDVMPTILDTLALSIPAQCDGRSLRSFLTGDEPKQWRNAAHWQYDFRDVVDGVPEQALGIGMEECQLTVLRDEQFKYVHFPALPSLLFDLERDPGEFVNRIDDPDYGSTAFAMAERMLAWRTCHQDRTLSGIRLTEQGPVKRQAHAMQSLSAEFAP